MNIGERIREARKAAHLTQQELADKLNVSYTLISQYERGIRNPKLETLKRIATALDFDLESLTDQITFKFYTENIPNGQKELQEESAPGRMYCESEIEKGKNPTDEENRKALLAVYDSLIEEDKEFVLALIKIYDQKIKQKKIHSDDPARR